MQTRTQVATSKLVPYAYIEGVLYPVLQATASFSAGGITASIIHAVIPYDPDLWPPYWAIDEADKPVYNWRNEEVEPVSGQTHDNGLEYRFNVSLHGVQENTMIHLFVVDVTTGEDYFVGEGKVKVVRKNRSMAGSTIELVAEGAMRDLVELHTYLTDYARSTGTTTEWNDMLGTASVSSIVSSFNSDSLATAFTNLLDRAGLNTDFHHHLHWRMRRLRQRLHALDNPKAMGSFNASRMKSVLEDAMGKVKGDAPISTAVLQAMNAFMYQCINVPFPSFINARIVAETTPSGPLSKSDIEVCRTEIVENAADIGLNDEDMAKLQMNEVWFTPKFYRAPPPRCNVIFPHQYDGYTNTYDFKEMPTRGIVRVTGEGRLTDVTGSNALTLPEEVKEGLAGNKYYSSPEERFRGIHMSPFGANKPEAIEDIGKDYVRGFLNTSYEDSKYNGVALSVNLTGFNPKVVPGLPMLLLSEDGDHVIGDLGGVRFTFTAEGASTTSLMISRAHPYNAPTSEVPMMLWYEQTMYHQENIGSYIYPKILGRYFEGELASQNEEAEVQEDMSILKHIYYAEDLDEEAVIAAKRSRKAIQIAVEVLYEIWKAAAAGEANVTPEWLGKYYGRRAWIGRKHLFEDFYHVTEHSTDWFVIGGGYTMSTNSCTTIMADEEVVVAEGEPAPESEIPALGELIPRDAELRGCFTKEIQDIMVPPALRAMSGILIPGSPTPGSPTRDERNLIEKMSDAVNIDSYRQTETTPEETEE